MSIDTIAVIVAAGRGSRAGDGVPKQYRPMGGKAVLTRTLDCFLGHPRIDRIVCAIHSDDGDLYADALERCAGDRAKVLPPVHGGATRQVSVHRAVEAAAELNPRICLVHDGARPFVDEDLIERAIGAAEREGAAVPGVEPTDTMKRVDGSGRVVETVDRSQLRRIQTPQSFAFDLLHAAHRSAHEANRGDFTDDGALVEWAGHAVHVFPGDPGNIKVTHAADFIEAERRLLVDGGAMITRVGTGFDVHAFTEGDHVWLGGIRLAHDRGVLAHSDGDVVLHALTDALLGAIGEGDIGTHFPPSDPQWRGAASDQFLAHAAEQVRKAGGVIDHLDITVLAERPKIGPARDAIRQRIAEVAGVPLRAVSIKATTTERLGFTGRGEGLAAQAAATIRMPADS